jgi:hypothetical protein
MLLPLAACRDALTQTSGATFLHVAIVKQATATDEKMVFCQFMTRKPRQVYKSIGSPDQLIPELDKSFARFDPSRRPRRVVELQESE